MLQGWATLPATRWHRPRATSTAARLARRPAISKPRSTSWTRSGMRSFLFTVCWLAIWQIKRGSPTAQAAAVVRSLGIRERQAFR